MSTDFGTDISTAPDLDESFAPLTGQAAVAESLLRRFQTPRGSLAFHPDDGLDLTEYLHEGVDAAMLYGLKSAIETECLKDERVLEAQASLAHADESLDVAIDVESADGPFRLTLRVTELSVEMLDAQ